MKNIVWERSFEITASMVNLNGNLGIFGLINYLQDISYLHGSILGYGYDQLIEKNIIVVALGQKIKMKRWPRLGDKISFKTWLRPISHKVLYRDVEVFLGNELIGECSLSFALINKDLKKMVSPAQFSDLSAVTFEKVLGLTANKIELEENLHLVDERKVRITDLDFHHHVNNTKYTYWALDSLDIEVHKNFLVSDFEINFISEAKLGESIQIYRSRVEEDVSNGQFVGIRETDNQKIFIINFSGEKLNNVNEST